MENQSGNSESESRATAELNGKIKIIHYGNGNS